MMTNGAFITGEYWVQQGHVDFADGDVGDNNHQGIATNHVFYKFSDQIISLAKQNSVDTSEAYQYGEVSSEGITDIIAHLRNLLGDDQIIMQEIGADPKAYEILASPHDSDASDYCIRYEGWIAVRNNNAELFGWNEQKKRELASGLDDILFQENIEDPPEEIEIYVQDLQTNRYFSLTLADLEGQPIRLQQQPDTTYNNKFIAAVPDNTENYFPPKKTTPPPGKHQAWWRVASESVVGSFKEWLASQLSPGYHRKIAPAIK